MGLNDLRFFVADDVISKNARGQLKTLSLNLKPRHELGSVVGYVTRLLLLHNSFLFISYFVYESLYFLQICARSKSDTDKVAQKDYRWYKQT